MFALIRIILWDIDGTLLDFLAAEKAAIRRCFELFNLGECSDAMLADYSAINLRYWEMLERGEMSKPRILVERFKTFFAKYDLNVGVAEAFNAEYQIRLGDTIAFYPTALETVRALKGVLSQYAVTNGTKTAQTRKLERSGLGKLLDGVFISDCIGAEKPSKAYFDAVFAAIGSPARDEVLIVGDSLTSDMRGGVDAGIKTCWFNPKLKPRPDNIRPDFEIDRLDKVLSLPGIIAQNTGKGKLME